MYFKLSAAQENYLLTQPETGKEEVAKKYTSPKELVLEHLSNKHLIKYFWSCKPEH